MCSKVFVLAVVFFVLFLGNTWTTLVVILAKFGGNQKRERIETIVTNVNSNNANDKKNE